jgi:hypothetical protein
LALTNNLLFAVCRIGYCTITHPSLLSVAAKEQRMPAQQITVISPARRRSYHSATPAYNDNSPTPLAPPPTPIPPIPNTLDQLAQTLTTLHDAVEQVLAGTATSAALEALQSSLTPTARQAEAAMRRLLGLPLANTALVVDLSQALTVLVLAADMLAQERRSAPMNVALYVLVQRNAERSLPNLETLSSQLANII